MIASTTFAVRDGRTVAIRPGNPSRPGRNYASAAVSRFSADWPTTLLTSDDALERDLYKLVARSREQRRNNGYVRHFDFMARSNIVGPAGIVSRPRPMTPENEIDVVAKKAVQVFLKRWAMPDSCDAFGRLSWPEMQGQGVGACVSSGEFLARKLYGADAGALGFSLQVLDPMSLDPHLRRDLPNGNRVRLGIEFDPRGVAVRYWIRTGGGRPFGLPTFSVGSQNFVGIDAREIVHTFVPEELQQKRGVPWVATALLRMRMLNAYNEAALVAARAGANKVAWITRKRNRGYQGPKDSEGYRTMNAEAGTIEELDEGSELLNYDPTYPHGEFDSFSKRMLMEIASGLLVGYTTLANDQEGASFSSERNRKLSERDVWRILQNVFVSQLVRPVVLEAIRHGLATRQIIGEDGTVYGLSDLERLSAIEFAPRSWTWATNPLQEASGAKLEVDAGFRSRDDVVLSVYGRDPAENDEEIRESQRRAEEMEIALSDPGTVSIKVSDTSEGESNG